MQKPESPCRHYAEEILCQTQSTPPSQVIESKTTVSKVGTRMKRSRKRTIEYIEAENKWLDLELRCLKIEVAFIEARRAAYPNLPDRIRLSTPSIGDPKNLVK